MKGRVKKPINIKPLATAASGTGATAANKTPKKIPATPIKKDFNALSSSRPLKQLGFFNNQRHRGTFFCAI